MMYNLPKKENLGKAKVKMRDKNKDTRGILSLCTYNHCNTRYSSTPRQININPHTKAYLLKFLLPNTEYQAFNKN